MSINQELKNLSRNFLANASVIRRENDMSKYRFANTVGVAPSTIYRMEAARKTRFGRGQQGYVPSMGTVIKMAQAIGATPDQLLLGKL